MEMTPEEHLKKFKEIYCQGPPNQGRVGNRPDAYLRELPRRELGSFDSSILQQWGYGKRKLERAEVGAICSDKKIHPLVAYACVMAWGGRNFRNYRRSLEEASLKRLEALLVELRQSQSPRQCSFDIAKQAADHIDGLGISFYTKLLFFLRKEKDAYILDQWTAKSAITLFPDCGVKINSSGLPLPTTTPETYEAFCRGIEKLKDALGKNWNTGEEVERALFDKPNGRWRNYLTKLFPDRKSEAKKRSNPPLPLDYASNAVQFAEYLKKIYERNARAGLNLPSKTVSFQASSNRVYCRRIGGVIWQFILARSKVRVQVFFDPVHVALYEELDSSLAHNHDFGDGIKGTVRWTPLVGQLGR